MSCDGAPVIALADFPRRDRCEAAHRAGAAAAIAKPWLNVDLLSVLQRLVAGDHSADAVRRTARAA
jgi:AmiR/NasT family two-component response regulator